MVGNSPVGNLGAGRCEKRRAQDPVRRRDIEGVVDDEGTERACRLDHQHPSGTVCSSQLADQSLRGEDR